MAAPTFLVDEQNPWPGLSSFTESAQDYFFGRENEIREILSRIEARPFTLLFGQSGLGKSSLLQAGIMPRLRKKNYLPVYFRLDYEAAAPGFDEQLSRALLRALAEIGAPVPAHPPGSVENESLWEWLHRNDTRPTDSAGRALTPIFIIDQFEEIFTLGERDAATRARSQEWFRSLAYLVENWCPGEVKTRMQEHDALLEELDLASHPVRILLSTREDFLPHLDEREGEMPSMMLNRLRLTPLRGTEALEAVLRPAPRLVTRQVAEDIVRFVAGEPKTDLRDIVIATPILNLVCRELNERRKARHLAIITPDLIEGDAGKILRQFYEECLEGQPLQLRIFIEEELLSASGHRENISEERADRVMAREGLPKSALEDLVARRLLQKEERLGRLRFELIHDVLCVPIGQSRDERAAREKEQRDQAEKKAVQAKIRQIRRRLSLAGVGLLVAAVLLAYAVWEGYQARQRSTQISRIITMMNDNHQRLVDIGSAYPEFKPMEMDVFTRDLDDINQVIQEGGVNNDVLWLKLSALLYLSDLLSADKNKDEKLKRTQEATDVANALIKIDHDDDDQARLGFYLGILSQAFFQVHDNEASQKTYDQAIHVLDGVSGKDPAVVHTWKALLINSFYADRIATLTSAEKDTLLKQCIAEAQGACQAQPGNVSYADNLAQMLITRASYLNDYQPRSAELGKLLVQIEQLEKTIAGLTDKLSSDRDIVTYRNNSATVYKTKGQIEQENDQWDQAEISFRNYVGMRKSEIAQNPAAMGKDYNYDTQRNLFAAAYNDWGDFDRARAKTLPRDIDQRNATLDEARNAYEESLQIGKDLIGASPKEADYWETLGNTYNGMKELAIDRANLALNAEPGDLVSARQFYQQAQDGLDEHIAALKSASEMADPDDKGERARSVAIALREEGEFEYDRAKSASENADACRGKALACYHDSLSLLADLIKQKPLDTGLELTTALAHQDLLSLAEAQAEAAGHDLQKSLYQTAEKEAEAYLQAMQSLVAQQQAAQADDLDNDSTLVDANVSQGDLFRSEANHLKPPPADAFARAGQSYQNGLAVAQAMTKKSPGSANVWTTLAQVYEAIAGSTGDQALASATQGDMVKAKVLYQLASDQIGQQVQAARQALAVATGSERPEKLHKVASALGSASYDLLFIGQYAAAAKDATEAIWDDPTKLWITTNQAHALLLEGRFDEAWDIYQQHAGERIYSDEQTTFAQAVLDDFDAFEKARAFFTPQQLADIERVRRQLHDLPAPGP